MRLWLPRSFCAVGIIATSARESRMEPESRAALARTVVFSAFAAGFAIVWASPPDTLLPALALACGVFAVAYFVATRVILRG